jgi:hypothetical protein
VNPHQWVQKKGVDDHHQSVNQKTKIAQVIFSHVFQNHPKRLTRWTNKLDEEARNRRLIRSLWECLTRLSESYAA